MSEWQYQTILIKYDKKEKNWVTKYSGKPTPVGIEAILNFLGNEGWELVNLTSEHLQAYPGFGKWFVEPEVYRATFKRLVSE